MNQLLAMKKTLRILLVLIILSSCSSTKNAEGRKDDGKLELNLILINDVYEIAPLSAGREGGMARVASLRKKYAQENKNTFLLVAGDFLSPSVYNSLLYQNRPIRGRQMVETMNAAGVDLVTFGNHEFDIRENELQERIDESGFHWISSNVFHQKGNHFYPFAKTNGNQFPKTLIMELQDDDGTKAKIGFIAICLPFNRADYVHYEDPITTAKILYNQLKDSVDAVVALTHQTMEEDKRLAREIPQLAAILGGHEHDGRFDKIGNVYITKALANARSAYVVELEINTRKHKVKVDPDLEIINETIPLDSNTNMVVQKWVAVADKSFEALGFHAANIVLDRGDPLEGREALIRSRPTNLGRMITEGMTFANPEADVVIFNSGSIRVDDILHMPVTEYDIIRTLPFGGGIREVEMRGNLLLQLLDQGQKNIGSGGYLIHNADKTNDGWKVKGSAIDLNKNYRVALSEFLLTGKEVHLEFLTEKNKDITKVYGVPRPGSLSSDIRLALIKYLQGK
jgi:2',3'-cyclic-nucleotide 2'-phosphodiesterase (5'-nucleotidase family)